MALTDSERDSLLVSVNDKLRYLISRLLDNSAESPQVLNSQQPADLMEGGKGGGAEAVTSTGTEDENVTLNGKPNARGLQTIWNELSVKGLIGCQRLSKKRLIGVKARLKENPGWGYPEWREYLEKVASTPWCTGHNSRHWRANFDYAMREKTMIAALEGAPPFNDGDEDDAWLNT